MKTDNCKTCGKPYSPACDFMQGRCPQHTALISKTVVLTRIQNILDFFKGKK